MFRSENRRTDLFFISGKSTSHFPSDRYARKGPTPAGLGRRGDTGRDTHAKIKRERERNRRGAWGGRAEGGRHKVRSFVFIMLYSSSCVVVHRVDQKSNSQPAPGCYATAAASETGAVCPLRGGEVATAPLKSCDYCRSRRKKCDGNRITACRCGGLKALAVCAT